MPHPSGHGPNAALRAIRGPLALTRLGMVAEQVLRAFWPFFTVLMVLLSATMLGLHDVLPVEVVWTGVVGGTLAVLATLVLGARRFHMPSREDALERLDTTLPGRPIQALLDDQAIGDQDSGTTALWKAHQSRMASRAAAAKPARPDLSLTRRDPYALRYVAMLALAAALLFGSFWRINSMAEMTPGAVGAAELASWEGWVEPPRYTGRPTIYLNDVDGPALDVPQGSRIVLRFYGPVGALTLAETVSGRIGDVPPAANQSHEFKVNQAGELRIDGTGGQDWQVALVPDRPPSVSVAGAATSQPSGEMNLPFTARDDYGVVAGTAHIELDLDAVQRRYGLLTEYQPRPPLDVPLPLPFTGERTEFTETFIEDFSKHPWAHLPVRITLSVEDAAGQVSAGEEYSTILPARRFFDPLAAAVIEQRRDLLWSRENAQRVAQVLRAISHRPDGVFRSETSYLRLRFTLRRLENMTKYGLKPAQQEEIAEALWDLAVLLEDGDIGDALERMRRAQDRLSQAIKDGASEEEVAELMRELREATQDYLRQLSRQAQQEGQQQDGDQPSGNDMQMTQNDLQRMMDQIQELMEQGRMAEAQQALEEFQKLMENMRVTQGQGGGQNEGQQAMEDLADTLREQQGLSDQAFRDLQEQFNPGAQAGENEGNEGRDGGQGRGESHSGQGGEGQADGGEQGEQGQGSLADRQQALRDQLNRQQGQLPGAGTEEGEAARESLDRAGRAMDGAEEALRDNDYAGAIDRQSEAMEALREGMRSLGEAMAQQNQGQFGQGNETGDLQAQNRDPLGRNPGSQGSMGTDDSLLQGEDVYRRARELLDEIRRRSSEGDRPQLELDYLRRLLDRF